MAIEVRRVQMLTDDERRILFGWGKGIFGADSPNLKMRKFKWHVVVYADGRPVCHVGLCLPAVKVGVRHIGILQWRPRWLARWVYRLVNLNVRSFFVIGAGGMVTPPDEQGQGYAALAGKYARRFAMDELHVDFSIMFSVDRLQHFHEQNWGARVIEAPVYLDQPSGKVRCPLNAMVVSLTGKDWPPGIVDIDGLPW